MTGARLALRAGLFACAGFAAAIVLALVAPLAAGGRPFTVLSGSMEPAIATGDVVVVSPIAPGEARAGDVVTFSDPEDPERLITHRVVSARPDGQRVDFVTRGDANTAAERWNVARDGEISRVAYRVPLAGRVALLTRSPGGLIAFVILPLLLLGGHELWRIWRPGPREARDGAPA